MMANEVYLTGASRGNNSTYLVWSEGIEWEPTEHLAVY
jgi:hypothetical protein